MFQSCFELELLLPLPASLLKGGAATEIELHSRSQLVNTCMSLAVLPSLLLYLASPAEPAGRQRSQGTLTNAPRQAPLDPVEPGSVLRDERGVPLERPPAPPPGAGLPSADHRLGPDDEVAIAVLQAPELDTRTRVSQQGFISLPLVGALQAGGRTAAELEAAIKGELGRRYIKNPEVGVRVTDVRSRAVSVIGSVQRPGVVQVPSSATLLDVLTMAGGLTADAGDVVSVMRAGGGAAGPVDIRLKELLESRTAASNLAIQPGDVVNVHAADVIYVVGAVNKPGAYTMRGNDRLTVLRALALGAGLAPAAAKGDAVVVRLDARGERVEIPVDLGAVLKGKQRDVVLEAHDVVFVPTSGSRVAARTTLDALVRILTWRPY